MKKFITLLFFISPFSLYADNIKEINACEEVSNFKVVLAYLNCGGSRHIGEQMLDSELHIDMAFKYLEMVKKSKKLESQDALIISFQSLNELEGIKAFFRTENMLVVLFEDGVQIYQPIQSKWRKLTVSY